MILSVTEFSHACFFFFFFHVLVVVHTEVLCGVDHIGDEEVKCFRQCEGHEMGLSLRRCFQRISSLILRKVMGFSRVYTVVRWAALAT